MGLLRSLITLALLAAFLVVGATVPLGKRTLFAHISNIWHADETQELVDGVVEKSEPVVERVKRGVEAGLADTPDEPPSAPESSEPAPVNDEDAPSVDGTQVVAETLSRDE
jgi:hypothetical protein